MNRANVGDHYGRERLKRALLHFITGRLVSGGLGIASLILVIRHLPTQEFGLYAAMLSLQVVFLAYSSFGVEPAMERYLPEIRLTAAPGTLLRFMGTVLLLRLIFLGLSVILLKGAVPLLARYLGMSDFDKILDSYVWVILAVALMNISGVALEALLQQKAAQFSAVLYAAIRFSFILYGVTQETLNIDEIVALDLYSALGAFSVSCIALLRYGMVDHKTCVSTSGTEKSTIWLRFRPFAAKNFSAQIVMQTYGPHALRLGVTSLSGLVETARLGFAMGLSELVQRYLPATLLMRMIRPVFVSRYVANGDFQQLNSFANLVLKLNVLALAPLLAFVAVCGDTFSSLVSAGKYEDAHWILFGVVFLLFPLSHQIVVSILANTLEENDVQVKSALVGLSGISVAYLFIPEFGAYGALLASVCSAIAYNLTTATLLRRRGYKYKVDYRGLLKLFTASAAGGFCAWATTFFFDGVIGLFLAGLTLLVVFVLVASRWKGFSWEERNLINGMLPRNIFFF
jgi:O-antigen/teichoic acid export membrane protein